MTTRPAILDCFARHQFLQRLDDQCLMDLAAGARPFTAAAGDLIGRAGDPARGFYLIQSGTVEVGADEGGEFAPLHAVGPGGVVGWSWLVPPHLWRFDCRATEPVTGLMFDADWLRDRCERNHELGYHLLREMVAYLAAEVVAARRELTTVG